MTCCVTGNRPSRFPFPRNESDPVYSLYQTMLFSQIELLIQKGFTHFISGMADGADLDFSRQVLILRERQKGILLEAALPFPVRPRKESTPYTEVRDTVLLQCDRKSTISPRYHPGCYERRNRYMVDHADLVLAIWNGEEKGGTWNTIEYARSRGKPIQYLMLQDILSLHARKSV